MTKKGSVFFPRRRFCERWFFWLAYTLHRQAKIKKENCELDMNIWMTLPSQHINTWCSNLMLCWISQMHLTGICICFETFEIATFQDWHKNRKSKKKKNIDFCALSRGISLWGNYLLGGNFSTLKGQPTAGGAIFCEKVCFSENPKFSIGCAYGLMAFGVCVLQNFHVMFYLLNFVFVFLVVIWQRVFFQCVDGCVCLLMGKQFMCFLNICECVVVCFSMPLGYVFGCYDACKCMQMSKLAIHIDV